MPYAGPQQDQQLKRSPPPATSCLLQSPSRPLGSQLGGPTAKKAVVMSQSGNPYAAPKHWADLEGPAPLNHSESE
eukprot:gene18786-25327_t